MRRIGLFILLLALAQTAIADPVAVQVLNEYRRQHGQAALSYSRSLESAATGHAQDMARGRFFDHRGSDGSSVGERVRRVGYGWCFVAENIAQGQPTLGAVMTDWANSQGHRRNMLDARAREFALVEGPDRIWVMVLATPGC